MEDSSRGAGDIFLYTCSRNPSSVSVDKRPAAVKVFKMIPQIFHNVRQQWEPLSLQTDVCFGAFSFVLNSSLIKCFKV